MPSVDWIKIKNEYINTRISYRKLADKHKISRSTLEKRALKEKWYECRKKQHDKIEAKMGQESVDKIVAEEINRLDNLFTVADQLLEKVKEATEQLNSHIVTKKEKTREIEYDDLGDSYKPIKETVCENTAVEFVAGDIDKKGLKYITGALKDIKDIFQTDKSDNGDPEDKTADKLSEIFWGVD